MTSRVYLLFTVYFIVNAFPADLYNLKLLNRAVVMGYDYNINI